MEPSWGSTRIPRSLATLPVPCAPSSTATRPDSPPTAACGWPTKARCRRSSPRGTTTARCPGARKNRLTAGTNLLLYPEDLALRDKRQVPPLGYQERVLPADGQAVAHAVGDY